MAGFYISAAHKSSGKTTISLGITAALKQSGLVVQTFKKGPDYIDPLWLHKASNRDCFNLDFFTSSETEIKQCFARQQQGSDISLVEGNKGLFDGLSLDGSDSNAALAKLLNLPVVLVIDTQGVTRGIAPLLLGYQQFDSALKFSGVILNKTGGERHESKLISAVEEYTDFKILGAVRKFRNVALVEEHLGLIPANEDAQAKDKISELAQVVSDSVDLRELIKGSATQPVGISDLLEEENVAAISNRVIKIAIAQDVAFGFYYADDLQALKQSNVQLVPVNLLNDNDFPDVDALIIGGGFPERHMQALEANTQMRQQIRLAIEAGLPTYAECGGLMYLTRSLQWNGKKAEMAGVIQADTVMLDRPQGRGYTKLYETEQMIWPDSSSTRLINAHEFHYSRLAGLTEDTRFAYRVERGVGIKDGMDGLIYKNLLASYTHLRSTENNRWVNRFVEFARKHSAGS